MGLLGGAKGWGCCKSLPNTGTPSKSHPCEVLQPFSVDGGAPLSPAPPAQRGQSPGWKLHWPPCVLLEPCWAWCPGRKGGSWAGQDAVLRPAEEVAFPAECSGASSSPWWDCSDPALLSPSPTWPGDEDGLISLHVSCHSWMFHTVLYPAGLSLSLLPPGPWESIPAFSVPPSLSAKYYTQGISVYPGSCHPHSDTESPEAATGQRQHRQG